MQSVDLASLGNLNLSTLCAPPGMPGLSITAGQFYAEAAAVCLDKFHAPIRELRVRGVCNESFALEWQQCNEQSQKTHADMADTTEFGAHAVAFVLSLELTNYQVLERSRKGTGFDYWLGNGSEPDLFKARLEISGILEGSDSAIKTRVNQKIAQTERSKKSGLPAYACVVEFSRPEAHFVQA